VKRRKGEKKKGGGAQSIHTLTKRAREKGENKEGGGGRVGSGEYGERR